MQVGSLTPWLPHWAVIRNARRRQRRRLTRRAMVLVALAALGVGLLTQHSTAGGSSPGAAARLSSVEVGGAYVLAAQAAGDRLWVDACVQLCGSDTGLDSERLIELDASSGAVIRRLPPQNNMTGFTIAGRGVWVAHFLSGVVTRLDPMTGRVTATVRLRLQTPIGGHDRQFLPEDVNYADGYVWASSARGWIAQINARTGALVRMLRTPSEDNLTASDRYGTWVAEELDGIGWLAPNTDRIMIHTVTQAGAPLDVYDVLNGGRVIWALASPDTTSTGAAKFVLSINPRTDRITHRVRAPTAESGAVVSGGALYLAALDRGRIYRVSRDGTLTSFSTPRHDAWLVAASRGALWAAISVTPKHRHERLLRISLPRT